MSLGGWDGPEIDPLEAAVNDITARTGALFVIAAGNSGQGGDHTVGTPGSAAAALTVGAVDRADAITEFSSRGPNLGPNVVKPDITAPGLGIVAAKAGTDDHVAYSGTSMATPHVAGAVALLAQQHPGWKAEQLKAAMTSSAKPTTGARVWDQGTGRVDVAAAITQPVRASTVDFEALRYPHDKPVVKPLMYYNDGAADVTLDVTVTGAIYSADVKKITVPAHGKAELPVIAKPANTQKGAFEGLVTATDGKTTVRSAVGAFVEEEMFDVTFQQYDRMGNVPDEEHAGYLWINLTTGARGYGALSGTTRLARGVYNFVELIDTPLDNSTTLMAEPDVVVAGNTTVKFDARLGRPVQHTTDHPDTKQHMPYMSAAVESGHQFVENSIVLVDEDNSTHPFYAVPSRAAKTASTLTYHHEETYTKPGLKLKLADYTAGRIPLVLSRRVHDSELARLDEEIHRQGGTQDTAWRQDFAFVPHEGLGGGDAALPASLGSKITTLVSAGPVFRWTHELAFEPDDVFNARLALAGRRYQKGERRTEKWNEAVNGPVFPTREPWFSREDDKIGGDVPLRGDGAHEYRPSEKNNEVKTFTLYRDGVPVGTQTGVSADFPVPAAASDYKLVVSAKQDMPWRTLSTEVTGEWTFRSAHADGVVPAPLSVIRYAPPVALDNSAKAGSALRVPVTVQRQPGSKPAAVKSLSVEVTYDDGRTWVKVPVVAGTARITHPALGQTNGFVGLRGTSSDVDGNTVTQTILRAYRLA